MIVFIEIYQVSLRKNRFYTCFVRMNSNDDHVLLFYKMNKYSSLRAKIIEPA